MGFIAFECHQYFLAGGGGNTPLVWGEGIGRMQIHHPSSLPFLICPIPPVPASGRRPRLCSRCQELQQMGFPFFPHQVLLFTRASPYQERPISPLMQAAELQALGDTSRDSPLISAKLLQSPTAHTQTRLFQRLVKLKQLWSDPYGNGNVPVFSTKSVFPHWISSPCFKVWKH